MSKIKIYYFLFLIVVSYVISYAMIILLVISFFMGDDGIFMFFDSLMLMVVFGFCLVLLQDLVNTLDNPRFDKSSLKPRIRKIFDWFMRRWYKG